MRMPILSRAAGAAAVALVSVLAFLMVAPPAAHATQDNPGGGINGCKAWPTKFSKSGTTITGQMTLECGAHWQFLRVGLVIAREGGGAASKTFYQKPMVECYGKTKCVATYTIQDVAGSQDYWLTNEPDGTWVSTGMAWTSPNGTTSGSGEMWCSGGDYQGIKCSSQRSTF